MLALWHKLQEILAIGFDALQEIKFLLWKYQDFNQIVYCPIHLKLKNNSYLFPW